MDLKTRAYLTERKRRNLTPTCLHCMAPQSRLTLGVHGWKSTHTGAGCPKCGFRGYQIRDMDEYLECLEELEYIWLQVETLPETEQDEIHHYLETRL